MSKIEYQFLINHAELLRDYAGYDFIQDEMEIAIKRFLHIYGQYIPTLYGYPQDLRINQWEVCAAGAGASKFVFGVSPSDEKKLTFALRLYNSISKMRDGEKMYNNAEEYQPHLETFDQKLLNVLVDEVRVYHEFEKQAQTSILIKGIWTRFPLDKSYLPQINEEYPCIDKFAYIEDLELKRLLVNLGINAITVGDFIVGYDGRKILERDEFQLEYKLKTIVAICNTMFQSWLFTTKYNEQQTIVGRTIVDLKPAQFVMQSDETKNNSLMPAVIIDVGPAENTDNIYHYAKDSTYMKNLVVAFASGMLGKIGLPTATFKNAKQFIFEEIINYLNQCPQMINKPNIIQMTEFSGLICEFTTYMKAKLSE